MYILGINISHDSSSCLLKNGEILFYKEDERISKIKHNNIDESRPNPFVYYHVEDIKFHTKFIDYICFSTFGDVLNDRIIISSILCQLNQSGIEFNEVVYEKNQHHLYHAANAAFSSGFQECACLIMDGCGAWYEYVENPFREIESVYSFNYNNGIKEKIKHYSKFKYLSNLKYDTFEIKNKSYILALTNSLGCGMLFSLFSKSLGYNFGHDAGKVMGLSSYGTNTKKYGKWFSYSDGIGITNDELIYPLINEFKFYPEKEQLNILKTLQEETKLHTIHLIKESLETCNTNNIVLSGGYFLNCVNNYHYLKYFPDVNFYVDPIAHDGGTAIGVAKYLWWNLTKDQTIRKLDSLYLG